MRLGQIGQIRKAKTGLAKVGLFQLIWAAIGPVLQYSTSSGNDHVKAWRNSGQHIPVT